MGCVRLLGVRNIGVVFEAVEEIDFEVEGLWVVAAEKLRLGEEAWEVGLVLVAGEALE